jgi:hypothetical protein
MDEILKRLEKIERLLESQNLVQKDVLNFNETSEYLELSHSHFVQINQYKANPSFLPARKKTLFQSARTGCMVTT